MTTRPTGPLTVVIATRDRPALLRDALASVRRTVRPGDTVVVVDSASLDPEVGAVARAGGATLVRCERPGTCRARNAGWAAATTDLVAFLDDDCRPEPGWAGAMVAAFGPGPGAGPGFVTGRVLADAGPGSGRAQMTLSVHDEPERRDCGPGDDPGTLGHGANMAWRRAVLAEIGGFDEALGPGTPLRAAEDHDAFWRALQAGYTGRFDPGPEVVHHQWRGRADQLRAYYGYGVGSGAFAVKQWRLEADPGVAAGALGWRPALARCARELVVAGGVRPVARNLAEGYQMGAVAETAKAAGSLVGALRARALTLIDGHFIAPAPPRPTGGTAGY